MPRPALQIALGLILWSILPLLILLALPAAIEADKMWRLKGAEEAVRAQMERDMEWAKRFGNYYQHSGRK